MSLINLISPFKHPETCRCKQSLLLYYDLMDSAIALNKLLCLQHHFTSKLNSCYIKRSLSDIGVWVWAVKQKSKQFKKHIIIAHNARFVSYSTKQKRYIGVVVAGQFICLSFFSLFVLVYLCNTKVHGMFEYNAMFYHMKQA